MSIFARLHNMAKSYINLSKTKLEVIDLTLTQAKVLSVLANNKEKMIQRELGEKSYLKAASISRMIDSLEEKDLVERDMNPKSRRSYMIILTNKGLDKHKQAASIFKDTEDEMFSHLTKEELNEFTRLIDKMTNEESIYVKTI